MSYCKVREGALIGSILASSVSLTARAQEQPPVETAQLQTPSNAVASTGSPFRVGTLDS